MTHSSIFPNDIHLFSHDRTCYPEDEGLMIPMQRIECDVINPDCVCIGLIDEIGILFRVHPGGFLISLN